MFGNLFLVPIALLCYMIERMSGDAWPARSRAIAFVPLVMLLFFWAWSWIVMRAIAQ